MGDVYKDDYYRARVDGGIVRLERSAKSYPSLGLMHASNTALAAALRASGVRRVLLDLRGGPPGRNDEKFEQQSAIWRNRLAEGADRVAILVRTLAGKLQSQRLARTEGRLAEHSVFLDETEALAYLRG
jgi:hypothetical protein